MTYWFDAAPQGEPYPVTVRFTGKHTGEAEDHTAANRTFDTHSTIHHVMPGAGRVALTARVDDLAPGPWHVTATPVAPPLPKIISGPSAPPTPPRLGPRAVATGKTTFAPVARVRAPGVRLGAWPAFVGIGAIVALSMQALLAAHRQLPDVGLLVLSVIASLLGLMGAKLYYSATHREEKTSVLRAGMCIQGFVLVAISTILLGSLILGIPIGRMLDVTAPGLLFGMSIGRLGCFFGGCCAGLPTASRWGIWSSDRTVGARRIPVQLVESASSGFIAVAALVAVLLTSPAGGVIFIAAVTANTFIRQLLFPLRGVPRTTAHGRTLTLAATTLVLVADLAIALTVAA
jgi:phosphatidylglycerol:prolipoprotein diacylglycerol transferase